TGPPVPSSPVEGEGETGPVRTHRASGAVPGPGQRRPVEAERPDDAQHVATIEVVSGAGAGELGAPALVAHDDRRMAATVAPPFALLEGTAPGGEPLAECVGLHDAPLVLVEAVVCLSACGAAVAGQK